MTQTFFVEMREEHIDDAAAVLTRSFLQLNDIWKQFSPTYEQIFPIMRGKIIPALKSAWSYVLLKDTKVIGVSIEYELLDYLKMPSMPSPLELFKILARAGVELEKKVDFSTLRKGDAIYGLFGVIDPDEASKGHSLKFWWNLFALGKMGGWKYYYSRISSPVSLKMLVQLGAEVLAEVTVEGTDNKEKLWMIRIDLKKHFPSYSELLALSRQKKPKPSL